MAPLIAVPLALVAIATTGPVVWAREIVSVAVADPEATLPLGCGPVENSRMQPYYESAANRSRQSANGCVNLSASKRHI